MISFIKKFIQVFKENYQIELSKLQQPKNKVKINSNETSNKFDTFTKDKEVKRKQTNSNSQTIGQYIYDSSSSSLSSCSSSSSGGSCD